MRKKAGPVVAALLLIVVIGLILIVGKKIENYKKALDIINKQLEDMKNGNFSEEDLNNAKTNIEKYGEYWCDLS